MSAPHAWLWVGLVLGLILAALFSLCSAPAFAEEPTYPSASAAVRILSRSATVQGVVKGVKKDFGMHNSLRMNAIEISPC